MNARDLKPLHKALLPSLQGYAAHKRLLLKSPMNGLLRAIHFDPSAFSKDDFCVATMVMPLCVPRDYLSLLFGYRLRTGTNGEVWTRKMPSLVVDLSMAIHKQAVPFLSQVDSLDDFIVVAKPYFGNPHAPKAVAYALARMERDEEAIATIDEYLPKLNLSVAWQQTIAEESKALRDMLINDPGEAHRKLEEWEGYTAGKLGLERFL